jgi:hypothetical protein
MIIGMSLLISVGSASAVSIDGSIAFGTAVGAFWTPTDSSFGTTGITTANADGVTFTDGDDAGSLIDEGLVTTSFGDYSGTNGSYVNFYNFVFNPFTSNTQLWAFSSGGTNYSFSMSTLTIFAQDANSITLKGTGIASIDGFDDTNGDYTLTLNSNGPAFSFSSSATAVVPIPAAVWLFGSGLLGLVGIARRKKIA